MQSSQCLHILQAKNWTSFFLPNRQNKCCLYSRLTLNINNLDRVEDWPQGSSLSPQPDMKSVLFIHSVLYIHISWSIGNKCSIYVVTGSNKVVELLHDEPTQTTDAFRHYMNYINNRKLLHGIRNKPVCWEGDSVYPCKSSYYSVATEKVSLKLHYKQFITTLDFDFVLK